ncbi:hypothetical protein C8J57DRAFT_1510508 [Mycena rebaudengoi]|nr:hypothetical protein C8J57DRAFT_1510508 [Mycena rebaudengoi]
MTVTNLNVGSLAARQAPFPPTDLPEISNACWSSSEAATDKCCTQFKGTRITLKDSSIAACSYHEDKDAWNACVLPAAGGSASTECDSSGGSNSGGGGSGSEGGSGGGNSGGSMKGVSSGGVMIASLLLAQVFTALLLS